MAEAPEERVPDCCLQSQHPDTEAQPGWCTVPSAAVCMPSPSPLPSQSQKKFGLGTGPSGMMASSAACLGADVLLKLLGNYCRNTGIQTAITVGVVGTLIRVAFSYCTSRIFSVENLLHDNLQTKTFMIFFLRLLCTSLAHTYPGLCSALQAVS